MIFSKLKKKPICLLLIAALFFTACSEESADGRSERASAPVEVAPVVDRSIRAYRTYSGQLESSAAFMVSPKVNGRIEAIHVDIGDSIESGMVVAELDAEEFKQAVMQAEAELLVAKANLVQAESELKQSERNLKRSEALHTRGIQSDSELDNITSELAMRKASRAVYAAQVQRAESALASAKIRLSYTDISASWSDAASVRLVADRYLDAGQTVTANTPILHIVDVDILTGVFFVTERDYVNLSIGQNVEVETDAYPNETFSGQIERIAPVFQENSRQARVEIRLDNSARKLNPGMFIRARVEVGFAENALVIPESALVKRNDAQGIFLLSEDGASVSWLEVQTGIRSNDFVQVIGSNIAGSVVTLGHQVLKDGSAVNVITANDSANSNASK